ncbi:hypothetical protein K474DRAFT_461397 [Panus rudis PR-1116 ss-1]|nr:hypothetical protein K474DRAFT_461397 [Panus rudis PR-1116 ss-1]
MERYDRVLRGPPLPTLDLLLMKRFRVLVVGKANSGKSTLADIVFGINMAARRGFGRRMIEHGITDPSNSQLIMHEYTMSETEEQSHFYSFLRSYTNPRDPMDERLSIIWICVSPNDNVNGLAEIIDICEGNVAIVVIFTKIDEIVFKVIMDLSFENLNDYRNYHWRINRAKEKSRIQLDPLHTQIVRNSKLPTVYTSTREELSDTIDELVARTEEALRNWLKTKSRLSFPILWWSVAQRHSRQIKLKTAAFVGRRRYWSNLSTEMLCGDSVETLTDVIHSDIIDIWNLGDSSQALQGATFKTKLFHLIEEILGPEADSGRRGDRSTRPDRRMDRLPKWAKAEYRATTMQVTRMMTYIVCLIIILDQLLLNGVTVTEADVLSAIDEYIDLDLRKDIREAIQDFSMPAPNTGGNLICAEIKRLIYKFCELSEED